MMSSVGTKFYRSMRKRLYRNGRLEYQQSERENMKSYLKCSIMITLTLMMAIGLAKAQPQAIGTTLQTNPYESNPSTYTATPGLSVINPAQMYDGLLSLVGSFYIANNGADAWVQVSGFDNPASLFTITWVDLKINFKVDAGLIDDTWRIEYTVGSQPWIVLIPDQVGKSFDSAAVAQTCAWSQISDPNGAWSWADISNLKVRFYTTAGADEFDDGYYMHIGEVWATVYSSPIPPSASTTMSIQPPNVNTLALGTRFFVDIYVQGAVNLAGYQIGIHYNTTHINAYAGWSYYPFTEASAADVFDDVNGYVETSYTIPIADPLAGTGVTGNFPIARIYFRMMTGTVASDYSWFRFTVSFIGDNEATKLAHAVYHGSYGTLPADTYMMGWKPASTFPYESPISTNWVEIFPIPGNTYHLTSWDDNEDGILNPSDQIDMTPILPPGDMKFFHVEQTWECDTATDKVVYMILWDKGQVPEFPLGIGAVLAIAPAIAVVYLWRTRKKVTKQ
jgi:hypothetical protein